MIPALPCGTFSDGNTPAGAFYVAAFEDGDTPHHVGEYRIETLVRALQALQACGYDDVEIGSFERVGKQHLLLIGPRRRGTVRRPATRLHRGTPCGGGVMSDLPATTSGCGSGDSTTARNSSSSGICARRTATDNEFLVMMQNSPTYQLDPFAKQIWLVKYGDSPAAIFCGRDGFLAIAHRSGCSTAWSRARTRMPTSSSGGAESTGRI
jgi:hypothetical protein